MFFLLPDDLQNYIYKFVFDDILTHLPQPKQRYRMKWYYKHSPMKYYYGDYQYNICNVFNQVTIMNNMYSNLHHEIDELY